MQVAFDHDEAVTHYLSPQSRFSWLQVGQLFRFPGSQRKLGRTKTGYRYHEGSPVFRTGARTAVIKLEE